LQAASYSRQNRRFLRLVADLAIGVHERDLEVLQVDLDAEEALDLKVSLPSPRMITACGASWTRTGPFLYGESTA
jgi:hypothetical protein